MKNEIHENLKAQREQLAALEAVLSDFDPEGLAEENNRLQQEALAISQENALLKSENTTLTERINTMMWNERMSITSHRYKTLNFYYQSEVKQMMDRITILENKYKNVITALKKSSDWEAAAAEPKLRDKLEETKAYFNNTIAQLRENVNKETEKIKQASHQDFNEELGSPLPTPEALGNRLRNFNMEMRFGGAVSNIVGIMLILLGVVFGLQHEGLPNELRGALAYGLGILFLAGGEFLQRSSKNTKSFFFLGVTAGGIAILFASTALAYFALGILSIPMALVLCVLTSAVAFVLAIRYSSRVIACFALIGGYMPITALTDYTVAGMFVTVMVYFALLTFWTIILASRKKWPVVSGLSFVLNTISAFVLLFFFIPGPPLAASLFYLIALFIMYIGMILAYPILNKSPSFTRLEIIILSANTIINCLMMYAVLNDHFSPFEHNGLLGIGYFILYFAGAKLIDRFLAGDKRVSLLFYLTALSFAILIIPMQFGADWLLTGWFVQGVTLISYGVLVKARGYERAGWLMLALAVFPFLLEVLFNIHTNRFLLLYTFVSAGLAVLVWVYHYANDKDALFEHTPKGRLVMAFRYVVVVQTCIYLLYAASELYWLAIDAWGWPYYIMGVTGTVAFLYEIGIKRIPGITDRTIEIMSLCITIGASFWTLIVNLFVVPSAPVPVIDIGLLTAFNIFSVFALWDGLNTIKKLSPAHKLPSNFADWNILITSVYAWLVITMMTVVQFEFNITSILVSAIGLVAALLWICFGFVRRNRNMRLFGLLFSFVSLVKLFFIDLYFLPQDMRIVSYFVFGLIFMAISFVYQYFNKKLIKESEKESEKDEVA